MIARPKALPLQMTTAERIAVGKNLHREVSRGAHADWNVDGRRVDLISILRSADATRQSQLLPLRRGRMLQSPFTFFRGIGRRAWSRSVEIAESA